MGVRRTIFLLLVLALLTTTARAAALPEGLAETLPEELAHAAETGDVLAGGAAWLCETACASLGGILRNAARSAVLLVLAALICGAAEGLAESAGKTAARYVPYCGVLAITTLATGDLRSLIGLGVRTVEELGTFSALLLPAMAASMAAGGLVSTASVWQVTTLLICDAFNSAAAKLLLPLTSCYIAAAAAGAALGEERLALLADGVKKLISGALTLGLAAFTAYLTVAGVLTGSADRTAVRAAKVALSGVVPVVGGVLGDAAEGVLAAAGTLRGTLGALGVFTILGACLLPLLRLGIQFLLYKAAAFAAGIAATKELGEFIDRIGEAFALVFAMTAACALVLLVALLVAVTASVG